MFSAAILAAFSSGIRHGLRQEVRIGEPWPEDTRHAATRIFVWYDSANAGQDGLGPVREAHTLSIVIVVPAPQGSHEQAYNDLTALCDRIYALYPVGATVGDRMVTGWTGSPTDAPVPGNIAATLAVTVEGR